MIRRGRLAALLLLLLLSGCAEEPLKVGVRSWVGYDVISMASQWGWIGPEVELISQESAAGSLSGLASGELQAACLTLGEVIRGLDQGLPLTIIAVMNVSSSRDTPELIFDVVAVRSDAVKRRKKALGKFVSAILRAQSHVHDNPVDTVYRLASLRGNPVWVTEEALRRVVIPTLDIQHGYFSRDSSLSAAVDRINELFVNAGVISAPRGNAGLLDPSYLPELAK